MPSIALKKTERVACLHVNKPRHDQCSDLWLGITFVGNIQYSIKLRQLFIIYTRMTYSLSISKMKNAATVTAAAVLGACCEFSFWFTNRIPTAKALPDFCYY